VRWLSDASYQLSGWTATIQFVPDPTLLPCSLSSSLTAGSATTTFAIGCTGDCVTAAAGGGSNQTSTSVICEWLITAPDSSVIIALSFSRFDTALDLDIVEVFDGPLADSTSTALYASGSAVPGPVFSSGSQLLVRWTARIAHAVNITNISFAPHAGFSAAVSFHADPTVVPCRYTTAVDRPSTIGCSGPCASVVAEQLCTWRLTAPYGYSVQLNFSHFRLLANTFFEVYDGDVTSAQILRASYGSTAPSTLQSSVRDMMIRFESAPNVALSGRGWVAQVSFVPNPLVQPCSSLAVITEPTTIGCVTTECYGPSLLCRWNVSAPSGSLVVLAFTRFSSEPDFDFVRVFDGPSTSAPLLLTVSGGDRPSEQLWSTQSHMVVQWSTDQENSYNGWSAAITFVPLTALRCQTVTAVSAVQPAVIGCTNGCYTTRVSCGWLVSAPADSVVQLNFTLLSIGLGAVFIRVYDGSSSAALNLLTITRATATNNPTPISHSSGPEMFVEFSTDDESQFTTHGWTAVVSSVANPTGAPCSDLSTIVDSPTAIGCTNACYASDQARRCRWQIAAPPGQSVVLSFTQLSLQPETDLLQVLNGFYNSSSSSSSSAASSASSLFRSDRAGSDTSNLAGLQLQSNGTELTLEWNRATSNSSRSNSSSSSTTSGSRGRGWRAAVSFVDGSCRELMPFQSTVPSRSLSIDLSRRNLTAMPAPCALPALELAESLDIRFNLITALGPDALQGASALVSLDLSDNRISVIAAGAFVSLTQLVTLRLAGNLLTSIDSDAFEGLSLLYSLELDRNSLQQLIPGVFQHLTSLSMLELNQNSLLALPAGVFTGLGSLHLLELNDNRLTMIEPGAFAELTRLEVLLINRNPLTQLQPGVFSELTNLIELHVRGNQLSSLTLGSSENTSENRQPTSNVTATLQAAVFDLPSLAFLNLDDNQISFIGNGTFSRLPQLSFLSLDNNLLTFVDDGMFRGPLPSLRTLFVSGNRLTGVSESAFQDLTALSSLWLDLNQITVIERRTFSTLPSLTQLNLSDNRISRIAIGAFAGPSSLVFLDLTSNRITSLQAGTFSDLPMSVLRLSSNRITAIEAGAFSGLDSVRIAQLSNNLLTFVSRATVSGLPNVNHLRLQNNNITSVSADAFRDLLFLGSVKLSNNSISRLENGTFSDCPALAVIELNDNHLAAIEPGVFSQLPNLFHLRLQNNHITRVAPGSFASELDSLTELSLQGNRLTAVLGGAFRGLEGSLAKLYLGSNSISVLESSSSEGSPFSSLSHLTMLDLSDNRLTSVSNETVPARLQTLLVHNNNLTRIAASLRNWASRFALFSTGGNPSRCLRVFDPVERATIGVCDCAGGFSGEEYCEPIDRFIQLPVYATAVAGLDLSGDSRVDLSQLSNRVPAFSQFPQLTTFTVPVDGEAAALEIPAVRSAFELSTESNAPLPAAQVRIDAALRDSVQQVVPVAVNPSVPTVLEYRLNGTLVGAAGAVGLSVVGSPGGLIFTGQLQRSGHFRFEAIARETLSGETKVVAVASLAVRDCGAQTCANGGTCVDEDGDPYNGGMACQCPPTFAGMFCTEAANATEDCGEATCRNGGTCVDDGNPFNRIFNCTCAAGFAGLLCDVQDQGPASSSSSELSTGAVIGLVLGVAALLLLLVVLVVRRLRRKNVPHNFREMLDMIPDLQDLEDEEVGHILPREIKRRAVRIICNLGKGNFGTVDKALLDEQRILGMPGYLVACKQLLSTRSEDRRALMEEAVVMAQFSSPHCVKLIGVVTVGHPVLVGAGSLCEAADNGLGGLANTFFFVSFQILLEYCEFGSLLMYLSEHGQSLKEHQRVLIAGDCAEGLTYLTDRGYLHRDIAARNVLVDSEHRAKVCKEVRSEEFCLF
jgi:Leucine-rich repeat (LRR) protein